MPSYPDILIQRSWRRTITLTVNAAGKVIVKVPYFVSRGAIDAFVEQHRQWIEKNILVQKKKSRPGSQKYRDGEIFIFLGKEYRLTIGNYPEIKIRENQLLFPEVSVFRIQKELETWYQRQARKIIRELAESYAQRMQVHYVSISFSDTSSKWGSCTHDNRLQFNWRLIMAPLSVVQYLVVHELVHILEKNHSSRFWSKVGVMHPAYKADNRWLKSHGHSLVI